MYVYINKYRDYTYSSLYTHICMCTSVSLKLPGDLAEEIANKPPTITI